MTTQKRDAPHTTLGWIRRGMMSNLAFPLAALATSPILARALEADGRGALAAVTIPFLIAVNTLTLGMPESLTVHVARRQVDRRQLVLLAIALPVALGAAVAGVGYLLIPAFLHQYPNLVWLGRLLLVLLPFGIAIQALRGAALGAGEYRLVFLERYLSVGLRLLPLLIFLALGILDVPAAALITIIAGIVSGLALLRAFNRVRNSAPCDRAIETPRLVKYGGIVWLGAVAQFLTFRVDQLVLATLVPAATLGAYAVAVSLAEVSNSVTSSIREIIFSRASGLRDAHLVARGSRLALALSGGVALVGGTATQFALTPIFGSGFEPAILLTQVLLIASVGSGVGAVVGVGLAVVGRAGFWSIAQMAGLITTGACIFPVVQQFGALGAAWLSVIAYWSTAAIGLFVLSRIEGLRIRTYLIPSRQDVAYLRGLRGSGPRGAS